MAEASCDEQFRLGQSHAAALRAWDQSSALPVLTAVPDDNQWSPEVVAERLNAFVTAALGALDRPRNRRPYKLLALPFFGTRGGGAGNHLGAALRGILDSISVLSNRHEVDIVLVLRDRAAFSLAQKLRREAANNSPWMSLGTHRHEKAQALGQQARAGQLVPFLGAGVSVSAGAPSWKELLSRLRQGVQLQDAQASAFESLGPLDQAGVLEQFYIEQHGSREAFGSAVAAAVDLPRYGLAPALLAAVPSSGAITLNYDRLFEMACSDAQQPRTVMPEGVPAVGSRWLLKLHGSVRQPESIVLTRDDYLGYSSNRAALSALVKAHLLTHHLLFVGFGLADDHFHEIVHDVRRAIPAASSDGHQMGTVLSLFDEPLQRLVWSGKLDILPMAASAPDKVSKDDDGAAAVAAAGRELEIFLDMMAAYATDNHSYLLAPAYNKGLSEGEAELRHQLLDLAGRKRTTETAEVWQVIDRALRDLGLPSQT
ncbi:SIR2 family protein [Arthrobacter sp. NPDC057009]|uniref:SIR2 family NAD-dependent protein deacylase n=1 Tax=Arthrobacter sp. NPDC057009 TaxID=3345996 RepID=UPI003637AAD7